MLQTARVPDEAKVRVPVARTRRREDVDERGRSVLEKLAQGEPTLGPLERCECFGMGTSLSIIRGRFRDAGWCLIITHVKRLPTWDELAYVRYELLPDDVNVAVPFPSSRNRVPLHKNSCHLWEVERKRGERRIHLLGERKP